MFCGKCGKEILEGNSFCIYCGNAVNTNKKQMMKSDSVEVINAIKLLFEKFEKMSKDKYILEKFSEVLGAGDDFAELLNGGLYSLLSHQFCEIAILNNSFSEEEKQILLVMDEDADLIEECSEIKNDPESHRNFICIDRDNVGSQVLTWAHIFAIATFFDDNEQYSDCIDLYQTIITKSTYISPNATQQAIEFAETNVSLFIELFNNVYNLNLENNSYGFIPTDEQEQTKETLIGVMSFLENNSEQFGNVADAIKAHLVTFGCSMIEKAKDLSIGRYQTLKYFIDEYFEEKTGMEFNALNVLSWNQATKISDIETVEVFDNLYETIPDFFLVLKDIDKSILEQGASFSLAQVTVLVYTRLQNYIVNAEGLINKDIAYKSEMLVAKIKELLNISEDDEVHSDKIYAVSGEVELSYFDLEIENIVEYSGELILKENGIIINDKYYGENFFESPPFNLFDFKLDRETQGYSLSFSSNGIYYRNDQIPTTFFIRNIDQYQIEQIKNYCSVININIEMCYHNKIEAENIIAEKIAIKNRNELENFICDKSYALFSDLKLLTLVIDHLINIGFFRKLEDCYEWCPDVMGPIMVDYNFDEDDFNRADGFLENFELLRNYLISDVDILNKTKAKINYFYISFKALFIVAVDLFHNYYISNLGYPLRDSIKSIALDLSENEALTYSDIMSATFFCYKEKLSKDHFAQIHDKLDNYIREYKCNKKQRNFNDSLKEKSIIKTTSIDDIDLMTGPEFENFIAELFSKKGYSTTVTKASGDQGIDVIAEKNNAKIGIQVKCYSGTVGNSAIQEVVAGKSFYSCDKVMVITNSSFTSSAIDLAQANNVILWDREILKDNL